MANEKWTVEKVGSGITAREMRRTSDPETMRAAFRSMAKSGKPTFTKKIDALIKWAESVLPPEQRPGGANSVQDMEADSDQDFAFQILRHSQVIEGTISAGRADEAARFSFNLGFIACSLDFKREWERQALKGKASIDGGRKGAALAHGTAEEKRVRTEMYIAAFNEEKAKGLNTCPAEAAVAKRFGVSERTIRRALGKK